MLIINWKCLLLNAKQITNDYYKWLNNYLLNLDYLKAEALIIRLIRYDKLILFSNLFRLLLEIAIILGLTYFYEIIDKTKCCYLILFIVR